VSLAGLLIALVGGASESRAANEPPPSPNEAAVADATVEVAPELGLKLGDLWLTPFVAPAYTPELGLVLAAGAMLSMRLDEQSPRSSLPMSVAYGM
jgi:hypothetical protein